MVPAISKHAASAGCEPPNLVTAEASLGIADPELAELAVILMRGDSMEPTLRSGDFALIDTGDTDISAGGVFAITNETGSLVIFQVDPVRDGRSTSRIRCTPRNRDYAPFELTLGQQVKIVGRVVQKVARL